MKKLLAICLFAVMGLSLAACGPKASEAPSNEQTEAGQDVITNDNNYPDQEPIEEPTTLADEVNQQAGYVNVVYTRGDGATLKVLSVNDQGAPTAIEFADETLTFTSIEIAADDETIMVAGLHWEEDGNDCMLEFNYLKSDDMIILKGFHTGEYMK